MKTLQAIYFISLSLLLISINSVLAEEIAVREPSTTAELSALTGRQILDEVSLRHDQAYEFEIQEMILVDKSGNEEQREMHRYQRDLGEGESRYISVFLAPSGIKGVSLLTWQHKESADDQWIYLPAYGRKMKRIAKGGRKNYFMGTDYTFEDLASEAHDKFEYQRLADEKINMLNTFVVKAVATDKSLIKETGYSYRKLWINQENYLLVKIDFFDKRERLIKRQFNSEPVNVQGQTWRSNRTEMEHFFNQHKTITVVRSRSFDSAAVPEKKFKERTVISGALVR